MIDQKLRDKAIKFAMEAHGDQKYSEVYSYVRHLEVVYEVLQEFGYGDDEVLVVGGWLHDTIEDTEVSYHDIKMAFGKEVAEAVYGVTDETGRNRKERKKKTYPKIRENGKSLILKLADRIGNVRFSVRGVFGNPSKLSMYQKEQAEFEKELGYPELSKKWSITVYSNIEERIADGKLLGMWDELKKLLK